MIKRDKNEKDSGRRGRGGNDKAAGITRHRLSPLLSFLFSLLCLPRRRPFALSFCSLSLVRLPPPQPHPQPLLPRARLNTDRGNTNATQAHAQRQVRKQKEKGKRTASKLSTNHRQGHARTQLFPRAPANAHAPMLTTVRMNRRKWKRGGEGAPKIQGKKAASVTSDNGVENDKRRKRQEGESERDLVHRQTNSDTQTHTEREKGGGGKTPKPLTTPKQKEK